MSCKPTQVFNSIWMFKFVSESVGIRRLMSLLSRPPSLDSLTAPIKYDPIKCRIQKWTHKFICLQAKKKKASKADGTPGKKKIKWNKKQKQKQQNPKRADDCEIETESLMNGPLSI